MTKPHPTRSRRGAATTEYLLIVAVLLLALILGLAFLPGLVRSSYHDAASGMKKENLLKVRALFGQEEPNRVRKQ